MEHNWSSRLTDLETDQEVRFLYNGEILTGFVVAIMSSIVREPSVTSIDYVSILVGARNIRLPGSSSYPRGLSSVQTTVGAHYNLAMSMCTRGVHGQNRTYNR